MNKERLKLVMLTGAGVSADSGVETFRDSGGLWAKYRVEEVCTPQALEKNPKLVLDFYNARRAQLKSVEPNSGHIAAAKLEEYFDVTVVTQNVDNLHERGGSTDVLHIHGELTKCRSMKDPSYVTSIEGDLNLGDLCPKGGQLRPHIVFFGEQVPLLERAAEIISEADIVVVAGTSMVVYPAASLLGYAPAKAPIYLLDPAEISIGYGAERVTHIKERFATAMPKLLELLLKRYNYTKL